MSAIHVVGVVVLIAIVAGVQIAVHRYSVRKRREATAGFWTRNIFDVYKRKDD